MTKAAIIRKTTFFFEAYVPWPGSFPSVPGVGSTGVSEHEFPMHVMELPGRVRALSAKPILSFSVSNIPTKAVKKALPSTIELSLSGSSAI